MNTNILNIKDPILSIQDLSVAYDKNVAVKNVSVGIKKNNVTAIMGPSGCGKSTLLRALNRMHELYENITTTGSVLLNDEDIFKMSPINYAGKQEWFFNAPTHSRP